MKATIKEELTSTRVQRTSNGKYNIIDKQGKPLSEEWKWIGYFDPGTGFARVQREDSKFNYIDKEGKILSEQQWYEWIDDEFHCDKARVKREDGLMNFITKQGKLLSDEWFIYADYFRHSDAFQTSFALVDRTNGESAIIDKNGNIEIVSK